MDQQKVDMYLISNQKYFPADKTMLLRDKMQQASDDKFAMIASIELKDPTTLFLVSLCLGWFGVDRFMLEDMGMGVLKLLTFGLCGILTLVDLFSVSQKTKERNFQRVYALL